jgi:hypothetical protein
MALGDMFNRTDYPNPNDIEHRFSFSANYMPVPASGDFRVDVGNDAQAELKTKLSALADQRIENAMGSFKQRMVDHLARMSDRLTIDYVSGEAKPRIFKDSLLETAHELCDWAKDLNIINDPTIEEARKALKKAIGGIDIKDLRKDVGARTDVKTQVDDILSKFSF